MRLSRLLLLPVAALSVAACSDDDDVSVNARPPLGGVRFINAVPDMRPFDIRMIDQVQWSASSVNEGNYGLAYRAGTVHWATEAKARPIRVFPADSNIAVASRILLDQTITIEPNKNVTLMLVPGPRTSATDSVAIVVIDDTPPTLSGQQIAARAVNAGVTGGIAAYLTATTTTALAGTPTWTVTDGFGAGSPYVVRDTGTFAVRAAARTAATTAIASATAPAGEPATENVGALAGFRAAGSALSAYVFPRACPTATLPITVANCPAAAGSSASTRTAYGAPGVVWFIDLIPLPPSGRPTP
jgi:hypothetical protein